MPHLAGKWFSKRLQTTAQNPADWESIPTDLCTEATPPSIPDNKETLFSYCAKGKLKYSSGIYGAKWNPWNSRMVLCISPQMKHQQWKVLPRNFSTEVHRKWAVNGGPELTVRSLRQLFTKSKSASAQMPCGVMGWLTLWTRRGGNTADYFHCQHNQLSFGG